MRFCCVTCALHTATAKRLSSRKKAKRSVLARREARFIEILSGRKLFSRDSSAVFFEGDLGGRFESDSTREVEAADHDACRGVQIVRGLGAEAARDHAIGADFAAERADTFLLQLIHRALVIAASGEEPLLAFED